MDIHGMSSPANRRGSDSVKWDTLGKNELGLWVADMDFSPPEEVQVAITERLAHPFLGYSMASPGWKASIQGWCSKNQGWTPENPLPLQGMMSGISAAVLASTSHGAVVLVEGPVYHPFYSVPPKLGRRVEAVSLIQTHNEHILKPMERDLGALSQRLKGGDVGAFLLCSPQNPGGRIWTREELIALGSLLESHGVVLIVDEIHGDLTRTSKDAQSFVSVGRLLQESAWGSKPPKTFVLQAPTKTFNIAGISSAWAICSTEELRDALASVVSGLGLEVINVLSFVAAEACYTHGKPWLDTLRAQLDANLLWFDSQVLSLKNSLGRGLQGAIPQAGYLYWLRYQDMVSMDSKSLVQTLRRKGLRVNPGAQFGATGEGFLRVNLACHPSTVEAAWSILSKEFLANHE